MANLTWSEVEVVDAMVALLDQQKENLQVSRVYWGDQDKIPDYPAICVLPFPKDRELSGEGATTRFAIMHRVGIYVYHGVVGSSEVNHRESSVLAESVERLLHEHTTLTGLVIFGFVTRTQPGFTLRDSSQVKVTRLQWEARSRQNFD